LHDHKEEGYEARVRPSKGFIALPILMGVKNSLDAPRTLKLGLISCDQRQEIGASSVEGVCCSDPIATRTRIGGTINQSKSVTMAKNQCQK